MQSCLKNTTQQSKFEPGQLVRCVAISVHNVFLAIGPHEDFPKVWRFVLIHSDCEYFHTQGVPFYDFHSRYEAIEE